MKCLFKIAMSDLQTDQFKKVWPNQSLHFYYEYQLSKVRRSLQVGDEVKIMVLLQATFLVSNGNNIVAYNFECFAANDVRGRQFATRNGTSCL